MSGLGTDDALIQPVPRASVAPRDEATAPMVRAAGGLPDVRGFRLIERVAEDAIATTYHAVDATGREVALKVLRGPMHPRRRERLLREARAAAAVRHENVVRVISAGLHEERPWVSFELVKGGTLAHLLDLRGRLGWREAARIGAQVARGLAALHAAGFVHRDVSPASVLRAERGVVKLGDLGFARPLLPTEGLALGLTPDDEVIGTPGYMSPEVVSKDPVGPAADLYSLGATLHHLVAGRPPFAGPDAQDVLRQHLHATPPLLSSLGVDVPPGFEGAVQRLMLKQPASRYPGAAEAASVLEVLASTRGDDPWPRRRVNVSAFVALAILVAMSAVGHAVFEEAIFGPTIPDGASATISAPAQTNAPVSVSLTTPEAVRLEVVFSRPGALAETTLSLVMREGQSTAAAGLPSTDGAYDVRVLINGHVAAQQPVTVDRTPPAISVSIVTVRDRAEFCLRASSDDPAALVETTRGWREGDRLWVALEDDFTEPDALWRDVTFAAQDRAGNVGRLTVRLVRPPWMPVGMHASGWVPASGGRCVVQGYVYILPGGGGELEMVYVPPTGRDGRDGFFIARTEVSQAQWARVLGQPPPPGRDADLPVRGIDARAASRWCAEAGLRLPRSTEWLRAARRPLSLLDHPWGDEAPDPSRCVWQPLVPGRPAAVEPVGGRERGASYFGCLDMTGNVTEWCYESPQEVRTWGGSAASPSIGLRADPAAGLAWAGLRPVVGELTPRPR